MGKDGKRAFSFSVVLLAAWATTLKTAISYQPSALSYENSELRNQNN